MISFRGIQTSFVGSWTWPFPGWLLSKKDDSHPDARVIVFVDKIIFFL